MATRKTLPVLPLRDIVVFPHMAAPLFVGREKSVRALDEVMRHDKQIVLAAQMDAAEDDPKPDRIYQVGALATVVQLLKLPDGTVRVLVEGGERAKIVKFADNAEYFEAEVEIVDEENVDTPEARATAKAVSEQFEAFAKLSRKTPAEVVSAVVQITEPSRLADTVAAHLSIKISDKQALLETADVPQRLEKVLGLIEGEIGVLQVERKIRNRVKRQMEKTQREYYLNEQMKAIQKELGDGDEGRDDLAELEERIRKTKLSKEARTKADAELKKLRQMSPMSAESTVVRNYLDWLLSIPWSVRKKVQKDLLTRRKNPRSRITTGWRRSKSASSNISRCRRARTNCAARSCALSALRASARPRSANPSRKRPGATSSACRSAACATKRKSAATGAHISAPCRDA